MAKGIKTGGRDFQKGHKLYPKERLTPEERKAKELTAVQYVRTINKYIHLDKKALEAAMVDPSTIALDLMVISILMHAISKGDPYRSDRLLERLVGKVPEKVDLSNEDGSLKSGSTVDLGSLTPEQLKTIQGILKPK